MEKRDDKKWEWVGICTQMALTVVIREAGVLAVIFLSATLKSTRFAQSINISHSGQSQRAAGNKDMYEVNTTRSVSA